tara:strand:+ start:434 stop:937 length:504 start_codon:yes stop_codon:yes gene_type:complete
MNEITKGVFESWVTNKFSAQTYLDLLWNNIRQFNEEKISFDNPSKSKDIFINDDLRLEKNIIVNPSEKNKEYYMKMMMNVIYDNKNQIPLEIGVITRKDKEYIYSIFVEESAIPYIIFAENNNMNIFFKKMSEGIANIDINKKKEKYKRNSLKAYKMNVLNDIYFNW